MKTPTRDQLASEIKHCDPNVKPDSLEFQAALTILAALVVGANVDRLVVFTKLPRRVVEAFDSNLRKSKVWMGEKTNADFSGESGGAEFWLTVTVACGYMERK